MYWICTLYSTSDKGEDNSCNTWLRECSTPDLLILLSYPNTCYINTCYTNTCYTNTCYTNTCYTNTCYPNTCYPNTCYPNTCYTNTCYTNMCYTNTCYTNMCWTINHTRALPLNSVKESPDPWGCTCWSLWSICVILALYQPEYTST